MGIGKCGNVDIMTVSYFKLSVKAALFCSQFSTFLEKERFAPRDTF
jgi:hypothetical protein